MSAIKQLLHQQQNDQMSAVLNQTKSEFLVDALIERLNDEWKVNCIESGRSVYHQLEVQVGRKYIKIVQYMMVGGERQRGNSVWMFVENATGACYKPASWKAPAQGIRYYIDQLVEYPHICDAYGSFLYMR